MHLALSLLVFRVHGKYLNLLSRRGEANISQMSPLKMKKNRWHAQARARKEMIYRGKENLLRIAGKYI